MMNLIFSDSFWDFNQNDEANFEWGLLTTVWNSGYYDNAGSSHLKKFYWIHVLKGYSIAITNFNECENFSDSELFKL